MTKYTSPDPEVSALIALCDRMGGFRQVADAIDANDQSIYQIISGVRLPSGNLKGIGPQIRKKLNERFPGWQSSKEQGLAADVTVEPVGANRVPLISQIQAGRWREIVDVFQPGDAEEWLLTNAQVSKSTFALRIHGDSMYRPDSPDSFRDGDVVIIDPEVAPRPGSFVAARNGKEEATFKKYRPRGLNDRGQEYFELVPLNPDYPIMRSDLESITIIGTAVEMRKKL